MSGVRGPCDEAAMRSAPEADQCRRTVERAVLASAIIGSGMTAENIRQYFPLADGFIVGSTFREEGRYLAMLDPARLRKFMRAFRSA